LGSLIKGGKGGRYSTKKKTQGDGPAFHSRPPEGGGEKTPPSPKHSPSPFPFLGSGEITNAWPRVEKLLKGDTAPPRKKKTRRLFLLRQSQNGGKRKKVYLLADW